MKEADIACNAVNLRTIGKDDDSKRPKNQGYGASRGKFPTQYGGRPRNTLLTKSREDVPNDHDTTKEETPAVSSCILCKGAHDLNSCQEFCKKDVKERKEFTKSKGLCFGCLKQGHVSKYCKKRKTCDTCGKLHPASLHGDVRKEMNDKKDSNPPGDPDESTVRCTKTCLMNNGFQHRMSSMIVPVWISHTDNVQEEKLVYALLDYQSDTTFISQETMNCLQVNGPKTQLSLSTMHAENELVPSQKIKGLVVSDINRNTTIQLPTTFSCESIPAKRQQISCPEMAQPWPHLDSIAHHLVPLQTDVSVGLLIGSNCSQAIMPREVIPGKPNEPYAQRTDLGWGIIGNVGGAVADEDIVSNGVANHISTESIQFPNASTQKTCHFTFKSSVKEVINPVRFREMLESDFSERSSDQPMSQDDKTFLLKMEQGVRQREDGHYEMPLPFRKESPVMPNNKSIALHRLTKLRTRMETNKRYRGDYITFMNELIERNYAERVPENELANEDGNVWYIPHHAVYHPRKPEKIRVVFDCSVNYKGESLNDHLLQGPDLTNQLVGVLADSGKILQPLCATWRRCSTCSKW